MIAELVRNVQADLQQILQNLLRVVPPCAATFQEIHLRKVALHIGRPVHDAHKGQHERNDAVRMRPPLMQSTSLPAELVQVSRPRGT